MRKNQAKAEKTWIFVDQKREETKHRTEWCAEANRYRCVRCDKGSKYHENAMEMKRTKIIVEKIGKMETASSGRS